MSFQIGDKVVHPMYGAGVLESVVQKKVDGVTREYYLMKLPQRSMVVMIPTENSEEIGVRPVIRREPARPGGLVLGRSPVRFAQPLLGADQLVLIRNEIKRMAV